MAKKKYYVVWSGRKTGVLESWEECLESVKGFQDAQYKSFKTLASAKEAFLHQYEDYAGKKTADLELFSDDTDLIDKPNLDTVSVDAACSGNPGIMEYQGVESESKKLIFKKGPFPNATNNMGEFLALVHALALMKKNNDKRPIYSDSITAISWVKAKTTKITIEKNDKNKNVFDLIERAENWLRNNDFDNEILKWETKIWGEIPADFGRK